MTPPLVPDVNDDEISRAVGWGGVRVVCVPAELVLLLGAVDWIWISVTTSDVVFSSVVSATACDSGIVIVFELLFSFWDATLMDFTMAWFFNISILF